MQASDVAGRTRMLVQLAGVVQAMRTVANAQRRQAQQQLSGLERYAAATRAVLESALASNAAPQPQDDRKPTNASQVVVLSSEHGFVGALNERLLEEGLDVSRTRRATLSVVGSRGLRLCQQRHLSVIDRGPMPTTLAAVQPTAQRLIEDMFDAIAEDGADELHLVFAEHRGALGWALRALRLFPPDVHIARIEDRQRPLHTLDSEVLVLRAIEEYAFALVTLAVSEAFACERAARLVAMDAARHHIDEKLDELRSIERALRQETITNEILEVASGAEAAEVSS